MAGLLINTLSHYRGAQKYLLHEFVVMPDHIHLMFTPCGITLERAMQFVKGGISYRAKKELGSMQKSGSADTWIIAFAMQMITRNMPFIYARILCRPYS
jgi:REP element-mobilizing transposase RayT